MTTLTHHESAKATATGSANSLRTDNSEVAASIHHSVKIVSSITVQRPATHLFAFWRNFENLSQVLNPPVSIQKISNMDSQWTVSTARAGEVEWKTTIINEHPHTMIAWRSLAGAQLANAGTVRFEPTADPEGTKVTVTFEYERPAGKLGALLAQLSDDEAGNQITAMLRRFKTLLETGETPAEKV